MSSDQSSAENPTSPPPVQASADKQDFASLLWANTEFEGTQKKTKKRKKDDNDSLLMTSEPEPFMKKKKKKRKRTFNEDTAESEAAINNIENEKGANDNGSLLMTSEPEPCMKKKKKKRKRTFNEDTAESEAVIGKKCEQVVIYSDHPLPENGALTFVKKNKNKRKNSSGKDKTPFKYKRL